MGQTESAPAKDDLKRTATTSPETVKLADAPLMERTTGQQSLDSRLGSKVEKQGSGLLFVNTARMQGTLTVLLLLRNSNHNDKTWGLPGGNRESGDGDSLSVAVREATEELGHLPQFKVRATTQVVRGKRGQKLFDVHIADVAPADASTFLPKLNSEHRDWKWVPAADAVLSAAWWASKGGADSRGYTEAQRWPLHPVVVILFADHWSRLAATASNGPDAATTTTAALALAGVGEGAAVATAR